MDSNVGASGRVIDITEIMRLIPHRYPFLLIDRVQDVVLGQSAVGVKNVTMNEPFFQGHFPDYPVMPGVLVVEAMAQTAAVLVMKTEGLCSDFVVYFMSIENARFRKPIHPGDRVLIHVDKQQHRGNVWKFKGEARVDGNLMAEATYAAMIVERK